MSYIYAQINEDNICIGVSQLNSEFNQSNMIRLNSLDYDKLGQKYENEQWYEIKNENSNEIESIDDKV